MAEDLVSVLAHQAHPLVGDGVVFHRTEGHPRASHEDVEGSQFSHHQGHHERLVGQEHEKVAPEGRQESGSEDPQPPRAGGYFRLHMRGRRVMVELSPQQRRQTGHGDKAQDKALDYREGEG